MPSLGIIWAQIVYILHIGFTITSSNGKIIEYIVPILLAFLQVKCQGIDEGPFTTHSKTMLMAIVSFLMHGFLAYGKKLRFDLHGNPPTYPFHCMVFLGNMSMAALASIFFPDSIRPVLYVLCVFISVGELLYWGDHHQRDQELIFLRQIRWFFNTLWMWSFGHFFSEQRDILPRFVINN